MRQAINNLQSTWTGLGFVSPDNVFKVCDQPHPITIRAMLNACYKGEVGKAMEKLDEVWNQGYASVDIVTTIFRVVKTMDSIPEAIKVGPAEKVTCALPLTSYRTARLYQGDWVYTHANSRRRLDSHSAWRSDGETVSDGESAYCATSVLLSFFISHRDWIPSSSKCVPAERSRHCIPVLYHDRDKASCNPVVHFFSAPATHSVRVGASATLGSQLQLIQGLLQPGLVDLEPRPCPLSSSSQSPPPSSSLASPSASSRCTSR